MPLEQNIGCYKIYLWKVSLYKGTCQQQEGGTWLCQISRSSSGHFHQGLCCWCFQQNLASSKGENWMLKTKINLLSVLDILKIGWIFKVSKCTLKNDVLDDPKGI